jgi:hypothetical protein
LFVVGSAGRGPPATEDGREGLASFRERRPPRFVGR